MRHERRNVHTAGGLGEQPPTLPACAEECVRRGPGDSGWVMQGRVCTLSVRLLFHSHMDLGLAMKSARRPDQALGGGQVAERINASPHTNGADGRSCQLVHSLRWRKMRGWFFFPLLANVLDVQLHMFWRRWGANCSPLGGESCACRRGWKLQPCLQVRGEGTRTGRASGDALKNLSGWINCRATPLKTFLRGLEQGWVSREQTGRVQSAS